MNTNKKSYGFPYRGYASIFVITNMDYIREEILKGKPVKIIFNELCSQEEIAINYGTFLYNVTKNVTNGLPISIFIEQHRNNKNGDGQSHVVPNSQVESVATKQQKSGRFQFNPVPDNKDLI